jgi:hypothetical protein
MVDAVTGGAAGVESTTADNDLNKYKLIVDSKFKKQYLILESTISSFMEPVCAKRPLLQINLP